jgi:twitching motility protein PilU
MQSLPTMDSLLEDMIMRHASDLYLTFGSPPSYRVADDMVPLETSPLDDAAIAGYLEQLLTPDQIDEFQTTLEFNTGMAFRDNLARFRINVFRQQQHSGLVIRRIQTDIPTAAGLGLTSAYTDLVMEKRGLVLVVGPTGSGKTTSMAAMIGHLNNNSSGHIITVEDPIEYVHTHKKCIITQRDVGLDTYSFSIALKNALRQRPDVVLIGEIREREVMEQALYFAETGHLCLATLHASNASQAIERAINFFPEERHPQILLNLSLNLRGILSQRLVANLKGGRSLAVEVMLNNGLIRQLVEEGKIRQIREMIERGTSEGMRTFDQSLVELFASGIISAEVAIAESDNPANVRLHIKQLETANKNTSSEKYVIKSARSAYTNNEQY